ncbi:MAG: hypothetical protein ABIP89_21505 [Polyangiaceae bacterium]
MKLINPRIHGLLDYLVILTFLLAPSIFHFSRTPTVICYTLAPIHATMTLLTAFPMGVVDLIPFKVHGVIELLVSLSLLAIPWVFGFGDQPVERAFFVAAGVTIFAVWGLTTYASEGHVAGSGRVHAPHLSERHA